MSKKNFQFQNKIIGSESLSGSSLTSNHCCKNFETRGGKYTEVKNKFHLEWRNFTKIYSKFLIKSSWRKSLFSWYEKIAWKNFKKFSKTNVGNHLTNIRNIIFQIHSESKNLPAIPARHFSKILNIFIRLSNQIVFSKILWGHQTWV